MDDLAKRPVSVTLIACVYIAVGGIGFAYHFPELLRSPSWQTTAVELIRLAAVLGGIYLLQGRNWARVLVIAWMGLHVVIGGFHSAIQFFVHLLFLLVIVWLLLRRADASAYFRA